MKYLCTDYIYDIVENKYTYSFFTPEGVEVYILVSKSASPTIQHAISRELAYRKLGVYPYIMTLSLISYRIISMSFATNSTVENLICLNV
ncbi:MAG: hypothetical protein NC453_12355 [Muribaculum sp.]|nr:hypothetical protein [Muribaculum sp.]